MIPTLLAEKLREILGTVILETKIEQGDLTAIVNPGRLVELVQQLRDNEEFRFDLLLDIAAVDNQARFPDAIEPPTHRFEVVYILNSTRYNHRVRVKIQLPETNPVAPTLTGLYASANWGEREAYDLMGIRFEGHPNLKRILTHFKFEGHALRKDYPVDREQWLDETEPMTDELLARLEKNGIKTRMET